MGTHEEAELAVVTAELDGGGEGGGGEEDGGDTDDGSLRREEGSGGRNNVSDKTLQQREEISRLNSFGGASVGAAGCATRNVRRTTPPGTHSGADRTVRIDRAPRLPFGSRVSRRAITPPRLPRQQLRIGFSTAADISRISHLLEAVEGRDGGDSLLGGNLNGGLGGDGGAEEGGGHGGHFV